jgi:heptosyltransferase II
LNIFIEIPTWLGDAVMTTPAIENIIKKYPDAKLTIFGSFVSTKLFSHHPNIQNIIIDESRKKGNRYFNLYRYATSAGTFDIALSFRKNFTTKFLFLFLKAKEKYIYKRFDNELNTHQVIRYNQFIQNVLDIDSEPRTLKIYLEQEIQKQDKPILGINPGATYGSAKRWYPEEFAKVAVQLADRFDIKIFGGPDEKDIANDIESYLKESNISNYENLAGKTTIEELIENIASLDLFITNDSGPMHIAAAFSVPTAAIFGPTRYRETSQWMNPKSIITRKELECSPCMKRVCPLKHHDCMRLITADTVLEELKKNHLI